MASGVNSILEFTFNACFSAVVLLSGLLGTSSNETSVLLIFVVWPVVTLGLVGIILWQRRINHRLKTLLPDHWKEIEQLTREEKR